MMRVWTHIVSAPAYIELEASRALPLPPMLHPDAQMPGGQLTLAGGFVRYGTDLALHLLEAGPLWMWCRSGLRLERSEVTTPARHTAQRDCNNKLWNEKKIPFGTRMPSYTNCTSRPSSTATVMALAILPADLQARLSAGAGRDCALAPAFLSVARARRRLRHRRLPQRASRCTATWPISTASSTRPIVGDCA